MTKIIIPNYGNGLNRGAAALLSSRIKTIKEQVPNSKFTVFSFNPELDHGIDKEYVKDNDIRFYEVPLRFGISPRNICKSTSSFLKLFFWPLAQRLNLHSFIKDERFKEYTTSDLIISTGGDVLTEDYGTISFISHIFNVFFGSLFGLPVVIFAESVGPFRKKWNRLIAKVLFNKAKLISVRESISMKNLLEIGVNKPPIYVTSDSAFLLKPCSLEKVETILLKYNVCKNQHIVGISLSRIIANYGFSNIPDGNTKYSMYSKIMAAVIDYLITQYNFIVILVPHVMEPPKNDDRIVNRDVYNLIENKSSCILLEEEYSAEELKGIIGICNLFIGSRMHSAVASTSMLVPTIAIAYSHKTNGIIGDSLGQKKYVVDINDFGYDQIVSKVDEIWNDKEKVTNNLKIKIEQIRKRSISNVELLKKIIQEP